MSNQPIYAYLIGPAGSGKSTLTSLLQEWIRRRGIDAITVNLDPGAENLPYTPDVDIRDWISFTEVMETYELGPNGAQIACADMVALNVDDIKESIDSYRTDFILLDTPGQLELFVFRESGKYLIDSLYPKQSVVIYLIDKVLCKNPNLFVSQLLLSLITHFRVGLPQINVLHKADLLSQAEMDQLLMWSADNELLKNALYDQQSSVYRELNEQIMQILEHFQITEELIPTGRDKYLGIDDVYTRIQLLFEGGEDLLSD
jgi:GTPase SAR1 family protein